VLACCYAAERGTVPPPEVLPVSVVANGKSEQRLRKPWKSTQGPSDDDYHLAVLLAAGAEHADIADARGVSVNQVAKAAERLRRNMRARTTVDAVAELALADPTRFRADRERARRVLELKFSAQISAAAG
jgi:hypothetical protein